MSNVKSDKDSEVCKADNIFITEATLKEELFTMEEIRLADEDNWR